MNRTFRFVFTLSLLISLLLLGNSQIARAATGSVSYDPALNTAGITCASSILGWSAIINGTTDDGSGFDYFFVVGFDGNGNVLSSSQSDITVGSSGQSSGPIFLTNMTARPVTVELIDAVSSATFSGQPVIASFTIDPASFAPSCASLPYFAPAGQHQPLFTDGRLNKDDAVESAAVYCENGGVTVYGIYAGKGFVAFKASKAEINAVSEKPQVNTSIKSAFGITLWRLTSGELQVNGPNNYVFIWTDSCS